MGSLHLPYLPLEVLLYACHSLILSMFLSQIKEAKIFQTRNRNRVVFLPKIRKRLILHKLFQGSDSFVQEGTSMSSSSLFPINIILPLLSRFEISEIQSLQFYLKNFQEKEIHSVNSNLDYCSIERKNFVTSGMTTKTL